ncbi:MAG: hypothetical protein D6705_17430 [Deltaproteobacteria bacterium]|nr:MAG: hypothetical protein D6705_17430 [Deltaproteobacteria bacterium]
MSLRVVLSVLAVAMALACSGDPADTAAGSGSTGATGATAATTAASSDASTATVGTSTGGSTSDADTGTTSTGASAGTTGDPCDCPPGECPPECAGPLEAEVGFIEIEPVTYRLHRPGQTLELTASAARMWYAFQPAADAPEDRPILLLFNGGPGAASEILFGFNTSQRSLDPAHNGGGDVGPSPAPWTDFANVLAIDARITGYAYNMVEGASDVAVRDAEFSARNFNPYLDGADFVRVLLRFLAAHPDLQDNPVVLVGESYGGTRATVMLDLLLDYAAHATGDLPYEDDALAAEIQAHLDAVFPGLGGQVAPPELVAQQFSRQILVQPLLLG